jgi:hypothetical protein
MYGNMGGGGGGVRVIYYRRPRAPSRPRRAITVAPGAYLGSVLIVDSIKYLVPVPKKNLFPHSQPVLHI